ncbi:gem-associated protein 5-like isoform X2 [Acropora palmata]|uniref:gem-associated protein 5-like isoform X2 n=1 Tax=Acropora palmata TaxID=6131 RepID=UPI003DA0E05A
MAADASRFVLPASPNWYCSNIADCSLNKIYVFGARNCLYLLNVDSQTPSFEGQLTGHAERVTSVCFSKHKVQANFVASGSDDKTVKIWDTETKLMLLEHKAHSGKVTCLSWSPLVRDLVVSGDEKGQVIVWRYEKGCVYGGCPVQDHIFSMALSYLTESELAVGYKSGLIVVLNISSDGALSVVNKLQGHSSEIHCLAWCPTPKQHIDFGPLQDKATAANGHLVVSGSRDQTIRLWDTSQGRVLSIKHLPKRSTQKWKDKYDPHWTKDRLWLSLCWPMASAGHLITSSQGGELLLWDLSKEGKEQYQTFGVGHSRIVFNISCDDAGTRLMTVSMDRQIVIWDPANLQSLHTLSTLGGFAYSLSISTLDPGTLGIGVGDNMLRVWQTASSQNPYETLTLWQGIKSKVMVVKWHPSKEGLLAFGADDGQVGVYNTISKRADISATYHKKTVYSLSWGPSCPQTDKDSMISHNLYSCAGDGRVYQHRTGHFMDDPIDVDALILKSNDIKHKPYGRTDVSWNLDGTVLALGNEDGSIEVFFPPDLKQIGLLMTHKKSITTLVWHHGFSDITTADVVSCKHWLASGSNESVIHVHDLNSMLGDFSNPRPRAAPITECFRQLSGHSGRVTGLSWSPHQSELLLSSSYDGTAQVWDVPKGEPLYNFRGHSSRVMCVVWSYLDPDLVYSGGEDGTVRPWRPSMQEHSQPPVQEKKTVHSTSKSSKNKKAKQKAKQRAQSIDKESWRQEKEPKQDNNGLLDNTQTTKTTNEKPMIEATTAPQENTFHATVTEENEMIEAECELPGVRASTETLQVDIKPSSADTKSKQEVGEVEMPTGKADGGDSVKNEGASVVDGMEKEKRLVESVIPLRSRVSLEPSSSVKKKKKVKSMFPVSAVADNKSKAASQDECLLLAKILYDQTDSNGSLTAPLHTEAGSDGLTNLGLFADRRAAYRMIATEGQHHEEIGNLDYRLQLEIWKGNLAGALEMATASKQLTDWLVALSPLAGRNVWMATTRAFANQLESQGAWQRAVLYYLACHDTYKAIEVFKKQAMYREAISLAKVRLSPLDPLLFELYSAWARKLETENSFEQAAKCYLAVKSSTEAVLVLCRRGDEPSLKTALQVALISGESELAISLSLRLTQSYLLTSNWKEAQEVLIGCPEVEAHLLYVYVHELLVVKLVEKEIIADDFIQDAACSKISSFLQANLDANQPMQLGKYISVDTQCGSPWIANSKPEKWFVISILQAWYDCGKFKPESALPMLKTLKTYYESIAVGTETIPEILSKLSLEITLGLLSALTGYLYAACQYWLQALSSSNKNCLFSLQRQLCFMLLPNGTRSLNNLLSLSHELCIVTTTDDSTLKAEAQELLVEHFNAYYSKALLTELWYRYPKAMLVLQCSQDEPFKDNDETSDGENDTSLYHCTSVGKSSGFAASTEVKGEEGAETKWCCENELLSPRESVSGSKQDLMSILQTFRNVLLSDRHAKLCNLRVLLTEIRKAMLLKRSRQFVYGKYLIQKKKKDKETNDPMAQPVGLSVNCSEDDATNETLSFNNAVKERMNGEAGNDEGHMVLNKQPKLQEEVTGAAFGKDTGKQGSSPSQDRSNNGSHEGATRSEIVTVALQTNDGQLPIDMRFNDSNARLDDLEVEELEVLRELEQYEMKDLPFPSPLESALTMGHFCSCTDGLSVSTADLQEFGESVVSWAQSHAQTSTDLKGVLRLQLLYSKDPMTIGNSIVKKR